MHKHVAYLLNKFDTFNRQFLLMGIVCVVTRYEILQRKKLLEVLELQ